MKVAVLIPVYNAEQYLAECLDSVLAQGVDVFCCDDGSFDRSAEILAAYAQRHPQLRYVRQPNRGVVSARNRLMDELPPEYEAFAFVDSDDLVAPGMYAALIEAMERTGAEIAECGMPGRSVASETLIRDMSAYLLSRTSVGAWVNVVNKFYRRSAVGKIRFREGLRFEEDRFFNYEVNAIATSKVIIPEVYYTYRANPNSATSALNHRRYLESTLLRIRLSLFEFLNAGRIPGQVEREWREELAKDAFRMCIRKNLKKNPDDSERRELFCRASDGLVELEQNFDFKPLGLNVIQKSIYDACIAKRYFLARVLSRLT